MLLSWLAVGGGAALGAWLRWGLSVLLNPYFTNLALGTLLVNLLGGYLIGVAVAWLSVNPHLDPAVRLLLVTGFLGGLTTFSSFSSEVIVLLSRQQWGWAAVTLLTHVFGSLVMTALGMLSFKYFNT